MADVETVAELVTRLGGVIAAIERAAALVDLDTTVAQALVEARLSVRVALKAARTCYVCTEAIGTDAAVLAKAPAHARCARKQGYAVPLT